MRGGFHGECDAFSRQVHLGHRDHDFLLHFYDFRRVFDEAVGELADVDQAILVDADIHECAEGRHVGDDTGQFHARLEVFHFLHTGLKRKRLKLLARIAPGFGQLAQNIIQGWQTDRFGDVLC